MMVLPYCGRAIFRQFLFLSILMPWSSLLHNNHIFTKPQLGQSNNYHHPNLLFASALSTSNDNSSKMIAHVDGYEFNYCSDVVLFEHSNHIDLDTMLYNCMNNSPSSLFPPSYYPDRYHNYRPTNVSIQIALNNIIHVDDLTSQFTMDFFFRIIWKDPRLTLPPALWQTYLHPKVQQEGIEISKYFDLQNELKFWLPDIYFSQSTEVDTLNNLIKLKENGSMYWARQMIVTFSNPQMPFYEFPNDKQTFTITLESFSYDSSFIRLQFQPNEHSTGGGADDDESNRHTSVKPVVLLKDAQQGGQDLVSTNQIWQYSHETSLIMTTDAPSPTNPYRTFSTAFINLHFSRQNKGVIFRLALPVLIFLIIVGASFWANEEDRMEVTLQIILVVAALYVIIGQSIPFVGYLTKMDLYIIGVFVILCVTITAHFFTTQLSRKALKYPLDGFYRDTMVILFRGFWMPLSIGLFVGLFGIVHRALILILAFFAGACILFVTGKFPLIIRSYYLSLIRLKIKSDLVDLEALDEKTELPMKLTFSEKWALYFAQCSQQDGRLHVLELFNKYRPGLDSANGVTGGSNHGVKDTLATPLTDKGHLYLRRHNSHRSIRSDEQEHRVLHETGGKALKSTGSFGSGMSVSVVSSESSSRSSGSYGNKNLSDPSHFPMGNKGKNQKTRGHYYGQPFLNSTTITASSSSTAAADRHEHRHHVKPTHSHSDNNMQTEGDDERIDGSKNSDDGDGYGHDDDVDDERLPHSNLLSLPSDILLGGESTNLTDIIFDNHTSSPYDPRRNSRTLDSLIVTEEGHMEKPQSPKGNQHPKLSPQQRKPQSASQPQVPSNSRSPPSDMNGKVRTRESHEPQQSVPGELPHSRNNDFNRRHNSQGKIQIDELVIEKERNQIGEQFSETSDVRAMRSSSISDMENAQPIRRSDASPSQAHENLSLNIEEVISYTQPSSQLHQRRTHNGRSPDDGQCNHHQRQRHHAWQHNGDSHQAPYTYHSHGSENSSIYNDIIVEEDASDNTETALATFKKNTAKEMGAVFKKREQAVQFISTASIRPKEQLHRSASTGSTRWKMK